ncbi:origin recognition complex subunit 4 C-terminus-domain-containing protein [Amylocarpus encephaloides]|uniref:Origin recognition complex subunit 4 n=1 Tax=Amylocarpus encephaloides TaxID=45428 RepID=A0A9P7YCB7_9HELO|nr:origin recognition complex subunit 4 C-terminus-domain-containing protein [Amylocarpus encephaloides]
MPASTPSIRKRNRAQLEEEDELSATPKNQKACSSASSSSSSPPPSDGLMGKLRHRLSNMSNIWKDKENRTSFCEDDELADQKKENNIYDVPDDSPDERRQSNSASRGRDSREALTPATGKTPTSNRRKSKSNGISGHAGDGNNDGDVKDKGTRSSQRRKSNKVGNAESSEIAKPPPHRQPMSTGFTKATKMKRAKAESRELARQNMQGGRSESEMKDGITTETITSSRRRSSRKNEESLPPSDSEQAAPSTVGIRSNRSVENRIFESEQAPKGILTPRKGRVGRPRKSVAFESNQEEVDLGFKDPPRSTSVKKSRAKEEDIYAVPEDSPSPSRMSTSKHPMTKQAAVEQVHADVDESEEESEEDTACSICSKLNSRKGNQILLCDKCNSGFHQKCCAVLVIPEGEWFCKECRPDNLNSDTTLSSLGVKISAIEGFEDHLRTTQRIVLDKLTGQKRINLRGHDEQLQKVQQIIEQTVLAGEGNSMMVIGGRGCGKTTLVESVISDISNEHRQSFHVVRLNGFIHTDDKIASREIWRQLGREMELEDDSKPSNHADTLASLLALLSHPSELAETSTEQTAKSVIFIIDEFDLFTTHPRQTLLYNLFDIAQARKAPISVLGLTTRIDVVEALEKRVKSRFSHRTVYLSFPRSPLMFWEICKESLTLSDDGADKEGFSLSMPGGSDFLAYWNTMIDNLYADDKSFKSQVSSHYSRTKSVPAFLNSCIMPIASLSSKNFPLTGKSFAASASLLAPPDSKLHMLQGLAEVELALLIAAARLDIIHDTDTCNFAMVYDEYSSLTSRHKVQTSSSGVTALGPSAKIWGRDVALGAWERLADCSLLVHANIGGGGGQNVGTGGRMWKVDVGLDEIAGSVYGLSGVHAKWCREI